MPPGDEAIHRMPAALVAMAFTLLPPKPSLVLQVVVRSLVLASLVLRAASRDFDLSVSSRRTSPLSVPIRIRPGPSLRIAHTMSLVRPLLFVQLLHSPYPSQRSRPAPHKPTHTDPSRSSNTAETASDSSPWAAPIRSHWPSIQRANPRSVVTIDRQST